jgi:hypothetical protein
LIVQKKDGTNVLAVRAGRPVTQTTPSFEGCPMGLPHCWNIYTIL